MAPPPLLLLQEYIPPPAAERHLTATMSLRRSPPPLKTRSAAAEVQEFCLSLVVTEKLLLRCRERREIRSFFSPSTDSRRQLNSPKVFRGKRDKMSLFKRKLKLHNLQLTKESSIFNMTFSLLCSLLRRLQPEDLNSEDLFRLEMSSEHISQ